MRSADGARQVARWFDTHCSQSNGIDALHPVPATFQGCIQYKVSRDAGGWSASAHAQSGRELALQCLGAPAGFLPPERDLSRSSNCFKNPMLGSTIVLMRWTYSKAVFNVGKDKAGCTLSASFFEPLVIISQAMSSAAERLRPSRQWIRTVSPASHAALRNATCHEARPIA